MFSTDYWKATAFRPLAQAIEKSAVEVPEHFPCWDP
jgi:hypothetical protein